MPAAPIGPKWATGSWQDTAWEEGTWVHVQGNLSFVLDLNTRLWVYLLDYYTLNGTNDDLTWLIDTYLDTALTQHEYTARMKKLIQDATDSMS